MLLFRACRKCTNGTLEVGTDYDHNLFVRCLQCGAYIEKPISVEQLKEMSSHKRVTQFPERRRVDEP